MRVAFILLAFMAAFAYSGKLSLGKFIGRELTYMKRVDPNMTETECVDRCDEFLEPLSPQTENQTDVLCTKKCHCFFKHLKHPKKCWH